MSTNKENILPNEKFTTLGKRIVSRPSRFTSPPPSPKKRRSQSSRTNNINNKPTVSKVELEYNGDITTFDDDKRRAGRSRSQDLEIMKTFSRPSACVKVVDCQIGNFVKPINSTAPCKRDVEFLKEPRDLTKLNSCPFVGQDNCATHFGPRILYIKQRYKDEQVRKQQQKKIQKQQQTIPQKEPVLISYKEIPQQMPTRISELNQKTLESYSVISQPQQQQQQQEQPLKPESHKDRPQQQQQEPKPHQKVPQPEQQQESELHQEAPQQQEQQPRELELHEEIPQQQLQEPELHEEVPQQEQEQEAEPHGEVPQQEQQLQETEQHEEVPQQEQEAEPHGEVPQQEQQLREPEQYEEVPQEEQQLQEPEQHEEVPQQEQQPQPEPHQEELQQQPLLVPRQQVIEVQAQQELHQPQPENVDRDGNNVVIENYIFQDHEHDGQLYGRDYNGDRMINIGNEIYCRHAIMLEVQSNKKFGSSIARRLIDGVFRPEEIYRRNCTLTGQRSRIGGRQHPGPPAESLRARDTIIEWAMSVARRIGLQQQPRRIYMKLMTEKIGEIKRIFRNERRN